MKKLNGKGIIGKEILEIVVKRGVQPARGLGYRYLRDLANKWKSESNVQSGLITGTQWDVMCNFIGWDVADKNCGTWGNYRDTESLVYSGYCSNSGSMKWIKVTNMLKYNTQGESIGYAVFPTGTFLTEHGLNTAQKNIYDIAGNVQEITTEVSGDGSDTMIRRGGDAGAETSSGDVRTATTRLGGHGREWEKSAWADGFRLVLYIKKLK